MELIFMQQIINEIYITFTEIFKKELEKRGICLYRGTYNIMYRTTKSTTDI